MRGAGLLRVGRVGLIGLGGLVGAVGAAGCSRHVVKVATEPGGASVTLNGASNRGDRWSVAPESAAEIVATWPDGQRLATALMVDRDMQVLLRKDGDPGQIVGARPLTRGASPGPPPVVSGPVVSGPVSGPVVSGPVAVPQSPAGDAMARARAQVEAGQKAYELTDYDVAIARFKAAYELIRDSADPRAPEILGNILYNLAVVYERSHDVTPEPERLRRARVMYRQFDEQMAGLVKGWAASAEHADVLSRIRALDARLGGS